MTTETIEPQTQATPNAETATQSMYSPDSERLLISTILSEDPAKKEIAAGLLAKISPTDFHIDQHAAIWRTAITLHDANMGCDATAIVDYSRKNRIFLGGIEYIFTLAEDVFSASAQKDTIKNAATRVKQLSTLRSLKQILTTGIHLCENSGNDYDQVLSLVEDDLLNLRKTSESSRVGPAHISDSVSALMERLERQMDGEQIGVGVPTGYSELDEITCGLVDEDLIVLAARPSMGKTAMMLNVARNVSTTGRPALVFSLEMKNMALAQRLLGRESRIPLQAIRTADVASTDVFSRLAEGVHRLGELPIYLDDTPGLTIHEIRSRARTFVAEHGKCVIFVDYLQHIAKRENNGGKNVEEKTHVSEASSGLKGIARELKVPVVALSQLNRALEQRANKRPIMSDLRESGSIEQDADVILFLYRDEVYNPTPENLGQLEVIISKQRDGAIGTVMLEFEKTAGLIQDPPRGY